MTTAHVVSDYCLKNNQEELTLHQLYEINRLAANPEGYDFEPDRSNKVWDNDFLLIVFNAVRECHGDERQERVLQVIKYEMDWRV